MFFFDAFNKNFFKDTYNTDIKKDKLEKAKKYCQAYLSKNFTQLSATHPILSEEKKFYLYLELGLMNAKSIDEISRLLNKAQMSLGFFEDGVEKNKEISKYKNTRYSGAVYFGGLKYRPLLYVVMDLEKKFTMRYKTPDLYNGYEEI